VIQHEGLSSPVFGVLHPPDKLFNLVRVDIVPVLDLIHMHLNLDGESALSAVSQGVDVVPWIGMGTVE
jgi:hypothetical protein